MPSILDSLINNRPAANTKLAQDLSARQQRMGIAPNVQTMPGMSVWEGLLNALGQDATNIGQGIKSGVDNLGTAMRLPPGSPPEAYDAVTNAAMATMGLGYGPAVGKMAMGANVPLNTLNMGLGGPLLNPIKNLPLKEKRKILRDQDYERTRWESKLKKSEGLLGGPKLKTEKEYREFADSRSKKRQRWPAEKREVYKQYQSTNDLRRINNLNKNYNDPLVDAQKSRPRKAEELKEAKKVLITDSDNLWSKTFQKEIVKESGYGDFGNVNRAVERANLEAVPRELKKLGWKVRHGSKGRGGRKSSRYVVSPDEKFEIRISDHELPETMERLHNRQQFGGSRWNDEIILDGKEDPKNLINEVLQKYEEFIE